MKNSYLNFELIEDEDCIINNFGDFYYLPEINDEVFDDRYYTKLKLDDNILIENVSKISFDNPDYWDLILLTNKINFIEDLPKTNNEVLEDIELEFEEYLNFIKTTNTYQLRKDEDILKEFNKLKINLNEKNRTIKIIKPEFLDLFIDFINKNTGKDRINKNILVSIKDK